jgi:hypothetical protein
MGMCEIIFAASRKYNHRIVLVPGMRYFKTAYVQEEGAVTTEAEDHLQAPGQSESLSGVVESQEVADPFDQFLASKSTAFLSAIVTAAQHISDFQTDVVADTNIPVFIRHPQN